MKRQILATYMIGLICITATALADGKVEAIGGAKTITVKRDGKLLQLKANDELRVGDLLTTTDQVADLRLVNRSLVRMGKNTEYQIGTKQVAGLWQDNLMKGFLRILVPESKTKNNTLKLKVTTPTGTIGVRGTEFTVTVDPSKTILHTLHGAVLMGPQNVDFKSTKNLVLVLRGFSAEIVKGAKKPSIPKAFDFEKYLEELDSKQEQNPFAALAERKTGMKVAAVITNETERPGFTETKRKVIKRSKVKFQPIVKTTAEELESLKKDLMQAVRDDEVDTVADLLEKLGEEGVRISTGDSILHVATVYSSEQTIQYLIDQGISVDIKNGNGDTPLMYVAGKSGVAEIAILLLQNGADPFLENKEGKAAIDMAKEAKHDDLVALFEEERKKTEE